MRIKLFQVDAFCATLFGGNPAAVCVLDHQLPDQLMQAIAAENNLSETAFVHRDEAAWSIRWFTPKVEVGLCGHATLAAARVLFDEYDTQADHLVFSSRSGPLSVTKEGRRLLLDFPADHLQPVSTPPAALIEGLGIRPLEVYIGIDYLVRLLDEEQVRGLQPDMSCLMLLDRRGVIVTAQGVDCDFVSRFFAPRVGIDEDPVTGSAHCALTPYWAEILDKEVLYARQLSQRGGELRCRMRGERVEIAGETAVYLRGDIELPDDMAV